MPPLVFLIFMAAAFILGVAEANRVIRAAEAGEARLHTRLNEFQKRIRDLEEKLKEKL